MAKKRAIESVQSAGTSDIQTTDSFVNPADALSNQILTPSSSMRVWHSSRQMDLQTITYQRRGMNSWDLIIPNRQYRTIPNFLSALLIFGRIIVNRICGGALVEMEVVAAVGVAGSRRNQRYTELLSTTVLLDESDESTETLALVGKGIVAAVGAAGNQRAIDMLSSIVYTDR
ncbi:hypothetical protein BC332_30885 [Capsicum chinense]|nr:hypothetical protein BC332_30885 [Capsicum chinense]